MSKKKPEIRIEPLCFTRELLMQVIPLGMSKIDNLIATEQLPSFKLGGAVMVHSRDVWRFLADQRNKQNPGLDLIL